LWEKTSNCINPWKKGKGIVPREKRETRLRRDSDVIKVQKVVLRLAGGVSPSLQLRQRKRNSEGRKWKHRERRGEKPVLSSFPMYSYTVTSTWGNGCKKENPDWPTPETYT